jgi:hypothetical protein
MSRFASFREFYPFYLSEHRHPVAPPALHRQLRRAAAGCGGDPARAADPVLAALFCGYGFAWVGHFFSRRTARPPSSIRCTRSWATG